MKPKVLLIGLPYVVKNIDTDRPKIRSFAAFPYGLLSLATYCKEYADIRIFDCAAVPNYSIPLEYELRNFPPDIVGFSMMFDNSYEKLPQLIQTVKNSTSCTSIILGGAAASYSAEEILREQSGIDAVCFSEGEIPFRDFILTGKFDDGAWITRNRANRNIPSLLSNIDHLIPLDYSFINIDNYNMQEAFSPYARYGKKCFFLHTSRGCFGNCIAGDTIVYTTEGDFPIRELAEKEGINVLSRDPVTQEPVYTKAEYIGRTQQLAELVRVFFDDGSCIDCTPDHRFKVFRYKNQFNMEEREYDVEAKDLKPKQQVRAARFDIDKTGRTAISTRRDVCIYKTRLIMEAELGRKLSPRERVHHKDHIPGNENFSNYLLTDKYTHQSLHPEVAERMRLNNPAKNRTKEWRDKITKAITGKKRTLEQRMRYRESKLGNKNPIYKETAYHRYAHPSRIKELDINHKVLKVEKLQHKEDVYCMEVPATHWFYANKVLVHNCSFCSNNFLHGRRVRQASVDTLIAHVKDLVDNHGMETLIIYDDQLLYNPDRAKEFFRRLITFNLRIECPNGVSVRFIDKEMAYLMRMAGFDTVYLAIESGSEYVLRELINKPLKLEEVAPAVQACREAGIFTHGFFVLGMPGETRNHREETRRFIKEIGLNWAGINLATPVRGSKLYDDCIRNGWIKKQKIEDIVDKKYIIEYPGVDPKEVEEHAYNINLDVNFHSNRDMLIGNYERAANCFREVLRRYGEHKWAKHYLLICEGKLEVKNGQVRRVH